MKRNTMIAVGAVVATVVGGAFAIPVLANGSFAGMGGHMGQGGMTQNMGDTENHGSMMQGGGDMEGHGQMMQQMQQMHGAGGGMMGGGMTSGGMMSGGMMGDQMAKFDTNADGRISPDERAAGLQAQLETFDTDGNGTLSLDEYSALFADLNRETMVDRFQALDNDGDAIVTSAEFAAPSKLMLKMQQMRDMHQSKDRGHMKKDSGDMKDEG